MSDKVGPTFIETRKRSEFSEMVVADFEKGLIREGFRPRTVSVSPIIWDSLGRIAGRVRYAPTGSRINEPPSIIGLMGLAERQLYPHVFFQRLIPFIWDCWPDREREWRSFFRRHRFLKIAFTSRDAAEYWSKELAGSQVTWMAEAIDHRAFTPGPLLEDRHSVLLEIGRRYDLGHETAKTALEHLASGHQYAPGGISGSFLPTRGDLITALRGNRALLCHPGSVSDPKGRTGSWETMTHRYLEAIATKTLVLGHVPREMCELFGFEPGISVTNEELPEALKTLRDDPVRFQPLVDRAYRRLLEVATWDVRSRELREFMAK